MHLYLKILALAAGLLVTMALPATTQTVGQSTRPLASQTSEFTASQRKEMGEIVREYLMANPEVLRDAFRELERKTALVRSETEKALIQSMAADIFRGPGDLVIGNRDGDVTMVEFFDYNCPYCKRSLPDVMKMIREDKNVKVVMKEFPILGKGSDFAARAAIASRAQGKYWEFHLALMKKRGQANEASVIKAAKKIGLDVVKLRKDMLAPEVDAIIKRNYAIAEQLNINGTPAFIIAENIFPGAVGFDVLSNAVAKVREDGGCKIC